MEQVARAHNRARSNPLHADRMDFPARRWHVRVFALETCIASVYGHSSVFHWRGTSSEQPNLLLSVHHHHPGIHNSLMVLPSGNGMAIEKYAHGQWPMLVRPRTESTADCSAAAHQRHSRADAQPLFVLCPVVL